MEPYGWTEVDDKRENVGYFSWVSTENGYAAHDNYFCIVILEKCNIKCAIEYHLSTCRPKSWSQIRHIKWSSNERVEVRGTVPTENVYSLEQCTDGIFFFCYDIRVLLR